MTQYINRFESVSGATGASGLLSPNVTTVASGDTSVLLMLDCGDNKEVEIKEQGGVLVMQEKSSGPEMVDLGLSVKWAKCNLGAENEQDYGNFYAWGETTGYTGITSDKEFRWSDYTMTASTVTGLVRDSEKDEGDYYAYSNDAETYYFDEETVGSSTYAFEKTGEDSFIFVSGNIMGNAGGYYFNKVNNMMSLDLTHDAATAALGSSYRMPTEAELQELLTGTTQEVVTVEGISGTRFTSKTNSNSIFVPFAGGCYNGSRSHEGGHSYLWSSSRNEDDAFGAWCLYCYSDGNRGVLDYGRYYGYSVRAVSQNSI